MKQLYLLRHAKSTWDDPTCSDFDRPLNERGRKAAALLAQFCKNKEIRPDCVICSPARRTSETVHLLLPALGQPPVIWDERVYDASCQTLLHCLTSLELDAGSVMLVGHNPGIERLVAVLSRPSDPNSAPLPDKYPTGGLSAMTSPAAAWSALTPETCRLDYFIRPADLEWS